MSGAMDLGLVVVGCTYVGAMLGIGLLRLRAAAGGPTRSD
jgi:hypothetical protein